MIRSLIFFVLCVAIAHWLVACGGKPTGGKGGGGGPKQGKGKQPPPKGKQPSPPPGHSGGQGGGGMGMGGGQKQGGGGNGQGDGDDQAPASLRLESVSRGFEDFSPERTRSVRPTIQLTQPGPDSVIRPSVPRKTTRVGTTPQGPRTLTPSGRALGTTGSRSPKRSIAGERPRIPPGKNTKKTHRLK